MSGGSSLALDLVDEEATATFAARLAHAFASEAGPLCFTLAGDLGSGKTTFARGVLRALGVRGTVRSPTFTLVEEHGAGGWGILHLDLYRLVEGDDLSSLGVRERLVGRTLLLVEWPTRAAPAALPEPDLAIALAVGDGSHRLQVSARTDAGRRILGRLAEAA